MLSIALRRLLAALLLGLLHIQTGAEFIQPVAVSVSNGEETQDALINGEAFDDSTVGSPASVHAQIGSQMWSVVGSIRAEATFDLGKAVDLTKVYIWNYNMGEDTDRGMQEVEVLVSGELNMATARFTGIAKILLKEGMETAQVFDVVGTNVRLVKLRGLSNWGHGWSVGLAEARFESGEIEGDVPVVIVNAPHEGDVIPLGTPITLDARITDANADLLKAEFFDGTTKLGEVTKSPFTNTIAQPTVGDHAYRIVATDKSGKVGWATVNVTVRELVADRIDQIDDNRDIGTELGQIKYTGTWTLAPGNANDPRFLNNDHYSEARNSYFEVRFKGVKIEVFATVASHHGNGIAQIDGGTEYTVVYKQALRREQVLVWSSPILANKEHALKIRVSGNGVVTADRFDIHVSNKPDQEKAVIQKVTATLSNVRIEMQDASGSVVDPATVQLQIDGTPASAAVQKNPPVTVISHSPTAPWLPGSQHTARVIAKDSPATTVTNETTFVLPSPFFPLTGLGLSPSTAGNWSLQQVWNAGRADALVSAVQLALLPSRADFAGQVHRAQVPVINFGNTPNPGGGGLIFDDQPLPAEASGLTENDFVLAAKTRVRFPRAGDWTIGVHSDEGFALRLAGAPFQSVSGNGVIDENFPEYIAFETNTGDSNTRGVARIPAAGVYDLEFVSWERTGAAYYEVYAAEGAFTEDAETDSWALIGGPGGLELVADAPKVTIVAVARANNQSLIEFTSTSAVNSHSVSATGDFQSWQSAPATFTDLGGGRIRATVTDAPADRRFYRVGAQ